MYYTYIHATPNGRVFYVGKGTGRRAYSSTSRTLEWRKMIEDNDGLCIQIVGKFETEAEAFEHERKLIEQYKLLGFHLVNLTEGGAGSLGYCQSEEVRKKKSLKIKGYVHKVITCPHCGTSGGETSLKRWHYANCRGSVKKFKARVTLNGQRLYLGKYDTKELADKIEAEFYASVGQQLSAL